MKNIFLLVITLLISNSVYANGSDGFGQIFNSFFGTEADKVAHATCDGGEGKGGIIGIVNGFFCHMEKDMGIKGVTTGVTKVFGTMSVRAVVSAGSYTVASVNYAFNAQVWVCHSACTATSGFNRAINLYFTALPDKTINKGHMLINPNAFESSGSATSAMNLQYDVGTGTTNKVVTAKVIFGNGSTTEKWRMDGSKSVSALGITGVMHNGTNGYRFATQLDPSTNAGGVYFEAPGATGTGTGPLSPSTSGDNLSSSSMCFTRAKSSADWAYTPTGSTGCTVKIFPADSNTAVSGYTSSSILTIGTLWESMAANPSSI
ncbi:MAG: hypothetical protein H7061_02785 [Bdellovibrionaceae bacterium]|nr:hypothetical protein [Bdellovibrio sp.]